MKSRAYEACARRIGLPIVVALGLASLGGCDSTLECGGEVQVNSTKRLPVGEARDDLWFYNNGEGEVEVRAGMLRGRLGDLAVGGVPILINGSELQATATEDDTIMISCKE